ncbi:MAG: hypothetical protein Q8N15_03670, partial [Bacillota bacterium]|nr:hypothetical protein [Bacillota bacterium]
KCDFAKDLDSMTNENQCYFGDWVRYNGQGDVGYYLGSKFVRYLLLKAHFDDIIQYDDEMVSARFLDFLK